MTLLSALSVLGDTSAVYENFGLVQAPPDIPPQIDASNFINHAQFIINFTNFSLNLPLTIPPYETQDTRNYTNDFGADMECNTGFRFDLYSSDTSQRTRASTVFNNGTVDCGTLGTSNFVVFNNFLFGSVLGTGSGIKCLIDSTNFFNPGTINIGFDGLLKVTAEKVDVSRGTLAMENSGATFLNTLVFFNSGFFDGYWGLGTNVISPASQYGSFPPESPFHTVTNRSYVVSLQQLGGTNYLTYLSDVTDITGSNRTVRAVFLANTNPAITAKVYLIDDFPNIIEWSTVYTNSGVLTTNYLYLEDSFLNFTNFQLLIDGFAGVGFNRPTFIPENFSFFQGGPLFFGPAATPTFIPPGTFFAQNVTNQYTAYEALFIPGSEVLGDTAGQNPTNLPGRIELTADKYMNLPLANISAVDYILLKATNQFGGSSGAQISAPYVDLNLRNTNGLFNLTNIVVPTLPLPEGTIDLYAGRWTNVIAGVTNRFEVLFANTQLSPVSPVIMPTAILRSTNSATHDDSIFISDIMNVSTTLVLDTRRLTIATNAADAPNPVGEINYLSSSILWPSATPRLQYFTNYGIITAPNLIVFGGSQTSPFSSPSTSTNPYVAFVNFGVVSNYASTIFSSYFQNPGIFSASGGGIQLLQNQTGILTNGAFLAPVPAGAITLQSRDLLISNYTLFAGGAISIWATNLLDDGSVSNSVDTISNRNFWNAGNGFSMPLLATQASLLGTTVTNTAATNATVINLWAGKDYGVLPIGYKTNGAVGHLILNGRSPNSLFVYQKTGAANAIYVDLLELQGFTTNANGVGNFSGVSIDPNFNIYYADAVVGGISIAEKLNGKYGATGTNGGRFLWVSNYNTGFFTSTNVTYTDGSGTHRLNQALVTSCTIDSNTNGIPNCMDPNPVPVLTPSTLILRATLTNGPPKKVVLSWNTIALSSNYLFAASSPTATGTNWQLVTNFLSANYPFGQVTLTELIRTNPPKYYKVSAQSP